VRTKTISEAKHSGTAGRREIARAAAPPSLQSVSEAFSETSFETPTAGQRRETFPKPPLKWAGGKRQLLEQLRKFIPGSYDRYFEPFRLAIYTYNFRWWRFAYHRLFTETPSGIRKH